MKIFFVIRFILSLLLKIALMYVTLKVIGTPDWAIIIVSAYILDEDIKDGGYL